MVVASGSRLRQATAQAWRAIPTKAAAWAAQAPWVGRSTAHRFAASRNRTGAAAKSEERFRAMRRNGVSGFAGLSWQGSWNPRPLSVACEPAQRAGLRSTLRDVHEHRGADKTWRPLPKIPFGFAEQEGAPISRPATSAGGRTVTDPLRGLGTLRQKSSMQSTCPY